MRLVVRSFLRQVRRSLLVCSSMLALLPGQASAELIAVDLASPGDGLVTRDTATGLEWLDLTLTTNLSVNAVLGGAGGWLASGWRYATGREIFRLWEDGGIVEISLFGSPANLPGIALLSGFLGETLGAEPGTGGLQPLSCPGPSCVELDFLSQQFGDQVGVASFGDVRFEIDFSSPYYGNWLVRNAIPEPATATLLSIGVTGLAATARKRRSVR